jgi:hypothetical protein
MKGWEKKNQFKLLLKNYLKNVILIQELNIYLLIQDK